MTHPLAPLHAVPQWVVVRLAPLPGGRTNKLPLHPVTMQPHDAHDPAAWLDYATAAACASALPDHTVGFVLTVADPFFCVDLDSCLTPTGWSPLALQVCSLLPNTVVEISQSGRGLHIWGHGAVPVHRKKNIPLHAEFYSELRFIAIGTGHVGDMTHPTPTAALDALVAAFFPPDAPSTGVTADDGPVPEWRGPVDDADLLRRAMQSRSAASTFGTRASFADLWTANADALARAYPPDSNSSEPFDRSSADAALAAHLAFWTGRDVARIERLMRQSALARPKYDREDYLVDRTIRGAAARATSVLVDAPPPVSPLASVAPIVADAPPVPPDMADVLPAAGFTPRTGTGFVTPSDASSLFAGCVYVAEHHKVMCPGGRAYKPEQFNAVFGGYTFVMDARNERTTRKAFEALTESQVMRPTIVDGTCFRPDLPYGAVVQSEGRSRVNTYWPANVRRIKGDPGPFLQHLARVLPDPDDQRLLLYYLAGCVQFAGRKFQWFPLLIGTEGNGKSLFSRCVSAAIGQRYTHWPSADKLGAQFNGWLFGKLLYCIEDIAIGDSAATWEKLKPYITGENVEVEQKGIDQRTDEICGNFIGNSNHKNAIRATANDRRVSQLWCAQQSKADLLRDGMGDGYMRTIYNWLRADGYAIVAEFLHTLPIPPEFGVEWLTGRAPRTSSTAAAVEIGMGPIEQEILEAIGQETPGFKGGWISSLAMDRLLERMNRTSAVPRAKRRDVLNSIGYDWHPALVPVQGRTHNVVLPDGGKPRLFCRTDRDDLRALSAADAARAYSAAQ